MANQAFQNPFPGLRVDGVVSGLITWSAPVAAFVAVDTFLLPGASLVPGFLEPFAGWMIAVGAAAFVYRKVK
ncbi:MAG: hypothetical protein AAF583_01570 [Pseudomonadota bacterium]